MVQEATATLREEMEGPVAAELQTATGEAEPPARDMLVVTGMHNNTWVAAAVVPAMQVMMRLCPVPVKVEMAQHHR
jgi:hypothetical protein